MAETIELKALARDKAGKGAARAIRREGRVPAVIYGDKQPPEMISLNYVDVLKQHNRGSFLSTVYTVDVGGKKVRAIPKDIQLDVVRDFPMHVDFLRVAKDTKVEVEVPVHFLNEEASPALKSGGVLNVVRHDLELLCPVDSIPEQIEVDLTGYDFGDSVHASDVSLPAGVEFVITDRDFTIATLVGSGGGSADTEEGEGGEGGEGGEAASES